MNVLSTAVSTNIKLLSNAFAAALDRCSVIGSVSYILKEAALPLLMLDAMKCDRYSL